MKIKNIVCIFGFIFLVIQTPVLADNSQEIESVLEEIAYAKQMGTEASLKSILSMQRADAEIYYDKKGSYNYEHNGTYKGSYKGFCRSAEFKKAQKSAKQYKRTLSCKDSVSAYRISVSLDKKKKLFCVDYTGVASETTMKISKTALVCPVEN